MAFRYRRYEPAETIRPVYSPVSGGGIALVRSGNGSFESIDFRETAPAAASEDMFAANPRLSLIGGLAVAVPGEPAGLEALHKYGRLPWSQLIEPAMKLAQDGFKLLPEAHAIVTNPTYESILKDPHFAEIYAPDGKVLPVGSTIYRRAYARTLESLARHGAKAMYTGPIARATVEAIRKNGGSMTLTDLANYSVVSRKSQKIRYRDLTLHSSPAPSSGTVVLSAMNILSGTRLEMQQEPLLTPDRL